MITMGILLKLQEDTKNKIVWSGYLLEIKIQEAINGLEYFMDQFDVLKEQVKTMQKVIEDQGIEDDKTKISKY